MTLLEWGIIVGIAATIIFGLLTLFHLIRLIMRQKRLNRFPKRPPKNKRKRQRWKKRQIELTNQRSGALKMFITFLILTALAGGGTGYGSYYQSTNLSENDSELVVQSYLLLRDFQSQIQAAGAATADEDAVTRNIRYLTTSLATYGSKLASTANTVEGQTVLNKYYAAVGELGMNASREINDFYGNSDLVATYENDIEKIKRLEEAAYSYYQVDQAEIDNQINEQEQ